MRWIVVRRRAACAKQKTRRPVGFAGLHVDVQDIRELDFCKEVVPRRGTQSQAITRLDENYGAFRGALPQTLAHVSLYCTTWRVMSTGVAASSVILAQRMGFAISQ